MKINWIGCKKKLLPQIIAHLPSKFKTYYEPFLGSGVLYFYLQPSKAILNDNDNQFNHYVETKSPKYPSFC